MLVMQYQDLAEEKNLPTADQPAAAWAGQSWRYRATMIPTMTMLTHMTIEPTISIGLRPTLSMMS